MNIRSMIVAVAAALAVPSLAAAETTENQTEIATLTPSVSAIGIGVTSLSASTVFYRDVLGMKSIAEYELGYMNEIVLVPAGGGSAIVLMEYTDGKERNVKDLPIKIVIRSEDPKALAAKIREAGYTIVREPAPAEAVGGALVGFAKDPDGYLIELLPNLPKKAD